MAAPLGRNFAKIGKECLNSVKNVKFIKCVNITLKRNINTRGNAC